MVERSLSSFPKFLSEGISNIVSPGNQPMSPTPGIGKGFESFIQAVNRYGSKYEEDENTRKELSLLQQKISSKDVTQSQVRDYLCRAIYCGILGYDVDFASIHAVKLAQQGSLLEKRTGYLAVSLLLHPGHELVLLLVNTIQKDLRSSNILENCMALTAASQLLGPEMIPAVLPLVLEKLRHNRELVRQKAVMCLYRFMLLAPDLLAHVKPELEKMLFDKDPGVMDAALNIVSYNIKQAPTKYTHLVDTLISVMQQVLSRKMSAMFEYHGVPFPWLQIKILYCLSNIAAVDEGSAKRLSLLLIEVLQRASAKESIAYALIYECLMCVSAIKPDRQLVEEASRHMGRFMRSADSTLRYVGVKALIGLAKVDPHFVTDYQGLIVDSLEQSDITIQRKTYKLLYQIANPSNVEVVTEKLLHQLEISLDKYWRSEVITLVMELSKRFQPSLTWQLNIRLRCLLLGRDSVTPTMVQSVISDLSENLAACNLELKQFLVKKSVECLMMDKTHPNVIQVTAWALAELTSLLTKLPEDRVLSLYTRHLCNQDNPDHVKAVLISGLQKLASDHVISKETMAKGIAGCLKVPQPMLIKQRLTILYQLCKLGTKISLRRDPDQFDFTLSFLDSYLSQCIEQGASPYKPRHLKLGTKTEDQSAVVSLADRVEIQTGSGTGYSSSQYKSGSSTSSGIIKDESEAKLDLSGVKRVWGRQGFMDKTPVSKTDHMDYEESGVSRERSERQKMAQALFGGLGPNNYKTEDVKGATGYTNLFGADDQDFSPALLPTADTAGWKKLHKVHLEKTDNGARKSFPINLPHKSDNKDSFDNDETDLTNQKMHYIDQEDENQTDTGYGSKIRYSEFDNHDLTADDQTLKINSARGNTDFTGNTAMQDYFDLSATALEREANDVSSKSSNREKTDKAVIAQKFESLSNMNKEINESVEESMSAQNDLDEALTQLLNDSSAFVNLSVDSSSERSDNKETDDVKVRESLYRVKHDGQSEDERDHQISDLENVKGSLYDEDI